ncbi:hypothetical protein NDU88_000315 [Pleurodeles waltl]|uniref:Uncharacterized protein n=1 Tax=Pleurodeles waltl TaxID=8319 RepID=A0AAV7S6M1_PLEWA|nr:hypothetical protein NDU88_000315 [Pleurodeles waltl]
MAVGHSQPWTKATKEEENPQRPQVEPWQGKAGACCSGEMFVARLRAPADPEVGQGGIALPLLQPHWEPRWTCSLRVANPACGEARWDLARGAGDWLWAEIGMQGPAWPPKATKRVLQMAMHWMRLCGAAGALQDLKEAQTVCGAEGPDITSFLGHTCGGHRAVRDCLKTSPPLLILHLVWSPAPCRTLQQADSAGGCGPV